MSNNESIDLDSKQKGQRAEEKSTYSVAQQGKFKNLATERNILCMPIVVTGMKFKRYNIFLATLLHVRQNFIRCLSDTQPSPCDQKSSHQAETGDDGSYTERHM